MNIISNLIKNFFFRLKYIKNVNLFSTLHSIKNMTLSKGSKIGAYATFKTYDSIKYGIINIEENVSIGESVYLFSGNGDININKNTIIGNKFTLLGGGCVKIGKNVLISHNVVIASSSHDMKDMGVNMVKSKNIFKKISIDNNVFIGANSTILMGSTIKNGAIIGAGSVVIEGTFIGKNEVWAGNPAILKYSRLPLKEQIEKDIHSYLKKYPFHNVFIMNKSKDKIGDIDAPEFGGTCSSRSIHFKKQLQKKYINCDVKIMLHRAFINEKDTHTIIKIIIKQETFFIDIGMGFPIVKLIPMNESIKFTSYGIIFESVCKNKDIFFYKEDKEVKIELMRINTNTQSEEDVYKKIIAKNDYIKELPMYKYLRYFFIHEGKFIQIKHVY